MNEAGIIQIIKSRADQVQFDEVIAFIDRHYQYTPERFINGLGDDALVNEAGVNQGSCKVFAFAMLNGLSASETLVCFGQHYRDVLADPQGINHANIRRFMKDGWAGIRFDKMPLSAK